MTRARQHALRIATNALSLARCEYPAAVADLAEQRDRFAAFDETQAALATAIADLDSPAPGLNGTLAHPQLAAETGECARCYGDVETCCCGALPYRELFVLDPETDEWSFECNVCGVDVMHADCPVHAPHHVPGLMLTLCTATPPHKRSWIAWCPDAEGVRNPCPFCLAESARIEHHTECAHRGHRLWQRTWAGHFIARRLARLGVVTVTYVHGGGCLGRRCCVEIRRRTPAAPGTAAPADSRV